MHRTKVYKLPYAHIHTQTYTYMHTQLQAVDVPGLSAEAMYAYIHTHTYINTRLQTFIFTHTYTYTNIHSHTYTYMHTQLQVVDVPGLSAEAVSALRAKKVLRTVLSYNDGAGTYIQKSLHACTHICVYEFSCRMCIHSHTYIHKYVYNYCA